MKKIPATPANSSKKVALSELVIFKEVIINKQNPNRLEDAFNICGDFSFIFKNITTNYRVFERL
ncbi:hypothetical protein [Halpernia frigidisoli]|uniref:hypothetical protein n=1 Tax=Halpernia frigidisoli TaxID=1125876 RepID=UPI0015A5D3E5|nr:hypothetical protein [Halpernia frigidisoli]